MASRRRLNPGLLLFALVAPLAHADCDYGEPAGLGPLSLRSQSPGQALRLAPMARAPGVLAAGEYEVRSAFAVTSIYAKDENYHMDFHLADTRLAVAAGLGSCWDLELAFDQRAIVDANLDDITLAFHRLFGFSSSGQEQAERNTTEIRIPRYGVALDKSDRGSFSRGVEITLTRLLQPRRDNRPAMAFSLMTRHESLGKDGDDGPDNDYALGLGAGQRLGQNHLYVDLTYTWFGVDRFRTLPLATHQFTGMLAFEWRRGDAFSWLAQYLYSGGVARDLGALSQPAHEVHLGAKWRIRKAVAEAALIENVINYDNGPDFGFAFGLKAPF